jgi:hypothetical protein
MKHHPHHPQQHQKESNQTTQTAPPPNRHPPPDPLTLPLERSTSRASPSECAGSVLTTTVASPSSANLTASAADVDVLPTPPLPPVITYLQRQEGPEGRGQST